MCEGGGSTNVGGAPASREEAARIIAANDETSFWRLRGVPGYQLDPVPWARVVRLVAEGTEAAFGQLGRSPAALVVYHRFKLEVQKEYVGVADYVQVKVFGLATALAPDGRKRVVVPADLDTREAVVVWRPNDFPYHLDPDVEHHNVWSTRPLPEAELHDVVRRNRAGYEWVAFINPAPIQTIPSARLPCRCSCPDAFAAVLIQSLLQSGTQAQVWHAHIISRPVRRGSKEGNVLAV